MFGSKVAGAIDILERAVLKTLLDEPLKPIHIAEILELDAIPKRPDGSRTNTSTHVITGILLGLERKEFVRQSRYGPWEITDLGREHVQT